VKKVGGDRRATRLATLIWGRAGPGFRPAERDAVKRTRSRMALRCSWVSASRAASAPFTS